MQPKSVKRFPRTNPEYGLVRRVVKKTGKSGSFVSQVKTGVAYSARIHAALQRERKLMRQEAEKRRCAV
jgi:hypothetical protein